MSSPTGDGPGAAEGAIRSGAAASGTDAIGAGAGKPDLAAFGAGSAGIERTRARYALALLFGINLLNFFDRQLPGALGEPIRKEFELSDTALGVIGTVFTLVYAAVGLPIGRLVDRANRVRLVSMGVAGWSIMTAASGLVWNYGSMVVARIGVGLGEAVCAPAGQSLIGDLFPPERRARALAVFMLGLPLGLFFAYLLSGVVGEALGWRAAFWFACLPGLLLAGLILLVPEPMRGAADRLRALAARGTGPTQTAELQTAATDPSRSAPAPGTMATFKTLLAIPTLWWIIASGALHNFNMYAINSFQTPFLQRFHELGLQQANMISAIALGAVGVIGLLGGGWIADQFVERRAERRLLLASGTMLVAAPCIYFAISQPSGSVVSFMLFMALGSTMMFVYYATVYSALQDVIEAGLRGTAVALYFFAMYVLGASFGPVALGAISDFFARRAMSAAGATEMAEPFRAAGLHDAMFVIPALALLAALVLFAGSRTVTADIRNRDGLQWRTSNGHEQRESRVFANHRKT
jgi:MFS family permease